MLIGRKRKEIAVGWRKLHIEELYSLYSSSYYDYQIREDEMGWTCSTHGRDEKCVLSFYRKI
jgi:hypothetical protein